MNKIMKKLSSMGILAILLAMGIIASPKYAFATSVQTSTWTAKLVALVSTNTSPTAVESVTGGVTPAGQFDLTRVMISTGYGDGTYFVCVDSFSRMDGGNLLTLFSPEQYLFPPLIFTTSTSAVHADLVNYAPTVLDLRAYNGGGVTVTKGLSCFIVGPSATTQKYWWTLETVQTPRGQER